MNIAIIGAGASGLAAAVAAAPNASVCVYEKKNMAGKKLLATGNGKCNLLNEEQDMGHFHSRNPEKAREVLSRVGTSEIKDFFAEIGILTTSRNGYLYPMSEQAKSVQTALVEAAKARGVKFVLDTEICSIRQIIASQKSRDHEEKDGSRHENSLTGNNGFELISTNGRKFYADRVILATGTRAGMRDNDNSGVELLKSVGHDVYPFSPALCALHVDSKMCKYWQGVRTKAEISLMVCGKEVAKDKGELMLTDYGISGIPAFQMSGYLTPETIKGAELIINWLPGLSEEEISSFLDKLGTSFKDKKLTESLYGILPAKLADTLINEACHSFNELNGLKSHLITWHELSLKQQSCILSVLKSLHLKISGLNGFENAQVCAGGVSLTEIDTGSCKSKLCENLFITGELLDVNGDCGGYNLQWAWTTGMLAGRTAMNDII